MNWGWGWMSPDIALAASAREWPDLIHRHLLDHGGGTIVGRLMGPEQAAETSFDVLFIDDICSFLTPRLVSEVKQSGAEVVGVFAPTDGSDAKRHLLECGISDVIESDATPIEFVEKAASAMTHRVVPIEQSAGSASRAVGVLGTTDGVGATEVAIALAQEIPGPAKVCLVDLDPTWPSVAQRLDLPMHPNIRSALDATLHHTGEIGSSIHRVGDVGVIGGVADQGSATPVAHAEASALLEDLGRLSDVVIADMGAVGPAIRGLIGRLESVVLIGTGDPVGVTRLLRSAEQLLDLAEPRATALIVNMTPRKRFHGSEIRREIQDAFPRIPVVMLPFDRRIAEAAWEGRQLARGPFRKAVGRMARLVAQEVRP